MGGKTWNDPIPTKTSSIGGMAVTQSTQKAFEKTTNVKKKMLVEERILSSKVKNPIILDLDVTGSMGNLAKIIRDRLKFMYGQIVRHNYLEDVAISFAGTGDADCDIAPIQVTEFLKGREKQTDPDKLSDAITEIWLEGGGGGDGDESYELTALFYVDADLHEMEQGFYFVIGDEGFKDELPKCYIEKHLGKKVEADIPGAEIFEKLKKKFEVFRIHKTYTGWSGYDDNIVKKWRKVLGDRVIVLPEDEPEAVVDIIIGCIALITGTRTLEEYCIDLKVKEQTDKRIANVKEALTAFSKNMGYPGEEKAEVQKKIEAMKKVAKKTDIFTMEPI